MRAVPYHYVVQSGRFYLLFKCTGGFDTQNCLLIKGQNCLLVNAHNYLDGYTKRQNKTVLPNCRNTKAGTFIGT